MSETEIQFLRNKAKLLQKAKKRAGKEIALKDAFDLMARGRGYSGWREMKKELESSPDFCPPGTSAYWKTWYATHTEAVAHLEKAGGYLLPFQKQFFVCDEHYIQALGVDAGDEDLRKVGTDWTRPLDIAAWSRLSERIRRARLK